MKKVEIFLIFIFLIGFLVRFFPVRTDSSFHYWDEAVYLQHAEILGGYREDNYNEFDFRPPLLPVLIALGYKVHHSVITAHLIVALIASLGIIFTFFLAKVLFCEEKTAMLAAIIFSLNPLHIQLAHEILVDSMLPAFWVLSVLLIFLATKKDKLLYYLLGGIFLSLSILLKFTSLSLLFPTIIILIVSKWKSKRSLAEFVRDRKTLALFLSSLLTLLPYLVFAQINFGFFAKPFILANMVVNWATPTPWHFFFTNFGEVFPLVLLLGVIFNVLFTCKRRKISTNEFFLIVLILIPFLLMQPLKHKEMRFLLPIVPFLSILSAKGFTLFSNAVGEKISLILILILLFSVAYKVLTLSCVQVLLNGKMFIDDWQPAIMQASIWIGKTTHPNIAVYSNFQYPPIAYYSMRKVHLLPMIRSFQEEIENVMPEPGYLVYFTLSLYKEPSLDFLMNDARFKLIKTFEDETGKVFIFEYNPKAT